MTIEESRGDHQHRHLLLAAGLEEVGQRLEALGDDEDRDRQRGDAAEAFTTLAAFEREEVVELALPHDLHPPRLDVRKVTGEGEARLLHPWVRDAIAQMTLPRQDLEVEIVKLLAEELAHLDEALIFSHGLLLRRRSPGRP